jgi:hypothetical protein
MVKVMVGFYVDVAAAGLTTEDGDVGAGLGRFLGGSGWGVPARVWVDGEWLRWERDEPDGWRSPRVVTPQPGLLWDFVALAGQGSEAIAEFAGRWGSLLNAPDRREGCSCAFCWPAFGGQLPRSLFHAHGAEPVDAWRSLAADAGAALQVAAKLRLGEAVSSEIWESFASFTVHRTQAAEHDECLVEVVRLDFRLAEPPSSDDSALWAAWHERERLRCASPLCWEQVSSGVLLTPRDAVALLVSRWLEIADPPMRLHWPPDAHPELRVEAAGLLGALGLQLAAALAGVERLGVCAGCRAVFPMRRQPPAGQRAWCPACRAKGAPQVAAKREWRARKRARERA